MNLFQNGSFVLNSGAESKWKIECDALSAQDWLTLAEMVSQMVGPFASVEGVPSGGIELANALIPMLSSHGPHLIVDDVLTTGKSMERLLSNYPGKRGIKGVVVFARGQCPYWIDAIFQMPRCLWIQPRKD